MNFAPRWRYVAGKLRGRWRFSRQMAANAALSAGHAAINPYNDEIELNEGVALEQERFR